MSVAGEGPADGRGRCPRYSVVIKWLRQGEVLARQALALRDICLAGTITITLPSLLAYGLANVLRYREDLTTRQVQAAVRSLFDMQMTWLMPSVEVMEQAVDLARTYETTVCDATFAALAKAVEARFITADRQLADKLEDIPFVCSLEELDLLG